MTYARVSHVRIRLPYLMLVRIDPGTEPAALRLDAIPMPVVRVRHPLPACTRIRILRPAVVLVGRSVLPRDFVPLLVAAEDVRAAVMIAEGFASPEGLHDWVLRMCDEVQAKRAPGLLARSA